MLPTETIRFFVYVPQQKPEVVEVSAVVDLTQVVEMLTLVPAELVIWRALSLTRKLAETATKPRAQIVSNLKFMVC